MPPTFRHSKSAYLAMIVGGTTTILSSAFDDSALNRAVDTAEVTAYGNNDKVFLAGLRHGDFPISGHFDKTIANTVAAVLGSSSNPTWVYGPEGNTTTRRKFTFGGVLESCNIKSPIKDKVSIDAKVTISGAVTSTTF